MLVAFGVILLMGIIVSDHLSAVRKQEPANLSNMGPLTASNVSGQDGPQAGRTQPLPGPSDLNTVSQPAPPQDNSTINPGATAVRPGQIATGPGPTAPPDNFIIQPVNVPRTSTDVIGRPTIDLNSDPVGPTAAPEKIHTVSKGDSLSSISKRYYNDPNQWQKIADANKLTKNSQLKLGMKLTIPAAKTAAPAPAAPSTQPASQSTPVASGSGSDTATPSASEMSYTVKSGDTLSTIAGKTLGNKNKWAIILDANKATLKDPKDLKVGMVLKVPRGSAI
jgi:LysM repeat protein